jgi:hypothetical protein
MSYIYHGKKGWILQPNRKITNWASGLCMIEEEYICANKNVDYNYFQVGNLIEDSTPCIDGAYIFTAPKYTDMGNGFIKASITAYGRSNANGSVDSSAGPSTIEFYVYAASYDPLQNYVVIEEVNLGSIPVVKSLPIIKKVIPKNSFPPSEVPAGTVGIFDTEGNDIAEKVFKPSDFSSYIKPSNYHGDFSGVKLNNSFTISRFDSVNFGNFNELTMQYIDASGKQYMPINESGEAIDVPFYRKQAPTFRQFNSAATSGMDVIYFDVQESIVVSGNYLLETATLTALELNNAKQISLLVTDQANATIFSSVFSSVSVLQNLGALSNGVYRVGLSATNEYGTEYRYGSFEIPLV